MSAAETANDDAQTAPSSVSNIATLPAPKPRRRVLRALLRGLLLILGPLAIAGAGAYWYVTGGRYVSTENAYVQSDKVAISTDVSGRVIGVHVRENQRVAKGELLFQLDDEQFRIELAHNEAQVQKARQEIEAMRAHYRQRTAELEMANADLAYYEGEFRRASDLRDKGHASQSKLDKARLDLDTARQKIHSVRQDIAGALASLGGNPNIKADEHPQVLETIAERNATALDLKRTYVRAPRAGIVSNIDLEVGEFVTAGKPVFSLIGVDQVWVEANLKETDLTYVHEGQNATVSVDTYPDHVWHARVASIAPATGAEFALLPPQNASGNWVKVVQRIPVRLEILDADDGPPLRTGMSVHVAIDTGHKRELPAVVTEALAWVNAQR